MPTRLVSVDVVYGAGSSLSVGDLTGDGRLELVVASSTYEPIYGVSLPPPLGASVLPDVSPVSFEIPGGYTFNNPTTGDVDGDGQTDLLVAGWGSPLCYGRGGASLAPGPLVGLDLLTPTLLEGRYHLDAIDGGGYSSSCSGEYVSRVLWDLDGDGDDEVVIGGESLLDIQPSDPNPRISHGGFALFDGGTLGAHRASDARAVVYAECGGAVGYEPFETVGDVTGDGQPDLAVSAPNFRFNNELGSRGAVFVASELHRARGTVPLSSVSCAAVFGDEIGAYLSTSGYVGDLDGDGIDDLVVSDRQAFGYEGAIYVFKGPVAGEHMASEADLIVLGDKGAFGTVVRGGVDVTGDGVPDLVVSAPAAEAGEPNRAGGYVYVVSGTDLASLFP